MKHLAMAAAGWWITWVLAGLIAWAAFGFLFLWAFSRFSRWQDRKEAALADEPVPYWPAANPCTWCQVRPAGMCTCTSVCGHIRCIGDHTSMAVLTAADMRMLHKWIKEGRE